MPGKHITRMFKGALVVGFIMALSYLPTIVLALAISTLIVYTVGYVAEVFF